MLQHWIEYRRSSLVQQTDKLGSQAMSSPGKLTYDRTWKPLAFLAVHAKLDRGFATAKRSFAPPLFSDEKYASRYLTWRLQSKRISHLS